LTGAIGEARFGEQADFAIGVEEELILVDPGSRALSHTGVDVLRRMSDADADAAGSVHPDTFSALIEFASPVARDAGEAVAALDALRARMRAAGGTAIGAGIHPEGAFGDVEHVDEPRYERIVDQLQGLIKRTPTCALHVHVGMPDPETAIRVFNGLREALPLLQALAANSPFWYGRDSGLATARAQLFRGLPRAEIPRAFRSYDDYSTTVEGIVEAGELPDYTFLWWDIRPHPRLGTVEVRAMDTQSALWSAAGLAALVHGLARAEASFPAGRAWLSREVLMEASFTAARDGLRARLPMDGTLRPAPEVARAALERARPHAAELGSAGALEGVERILAEGNGADRQRAAHARGGLPALLDLLVAETEQPYR
jgi:glutamate---cysteine ligase / carboxylate-amine ligase